MSEKKKGLDQIDWLQIQALTNLFKSDRRQFLAENYMTEREWQHWTAIAEELFSLIWESPGGVRVVLEDGTPVREVAAPPASAQESQFNPLVMLIARARGVRIALSFEEVPFGDGDILLGDYDDEDEDEGS